MEKHGTPVNREDDRGSCKSAGNDLLSRCKHYHRPQVLIGRVRDGNGSFHLGEITGKLPEISVTTWGHEVASSDSRATSKSENKVAKQSAVSTG